MVLWSGRRFEVSQMAWRFSEQAVSRPRLERVRLRYPQRWSLSRVPGVAQIRKNEKEHALLYSGFSKARQRWVVTAAMNHLLLDLRPSSVTTDPTPGSA